MFKLEEYVATMTVWYCVLLLGRYTLRTALRNQMLT